MRFLCAFSSVSLYAIIFSTTVMAAEAEQSNIIVTANPIVEQIANRVLQTAGGVDVVSDDRFANQMAVSLRDALAFSPGVYAQPRFGQEVRISIRGSGLSRGYHMRGLTLMQDGIPINQADDNGDFQELDPQIFQHIEVYRGANALRFGGSTLGGAINAVTPTGRMHSGGEARIDGGSFDTLRTKLAYGFADERADVWAAITTDRSDGDRDHGRRKSLRFNGNVGVNLSDTVETRFYVSAQTMRQDLSGALSEKDVLTNPKKGSFVGDQQRNIDSIRVQNRTTVHLGSADLNFGGYFNAKTLIHPIYMFLDQQSLDRGAFASMDWSGDISGLPVELSIGTQARFGTTAARQFVNLNGKRGILTANAQQKARTINSYGELRVAPIDDLWLIAGLTHVDGQRSVDNRLALARSGTAHFDAFAPKFGLLYEAHKAVQFYANYSRSVELPGLAELSQTPSGGVPGFTPVGLQKAWTAEIGTRGRNGALGWDVSLYRADIHGEMLQYNVVAGVIPAATFNAGKTRHQGVEASIEIEFAPWLNLRQMYQYSDFRFRHDSQFGDNRLPVIPRHFYRGQLRLGTEQLNLKPSVEWVPQGAWVDYRNSKRTSGYALFNLGAQAEMKNGMTVFVDARNITAKKAVGDISALIGYVPDNPATIADEGSVAFYPIERRAIYAGIRARF